MPGLVGYINLKEDKTDTTLISNMCSILKHREWYKIERYADERRGFAVSHIHLGIIQNSNFPYISKDGKIKIFLHGELYNDNAIKYSNQLEFIYHKYKENGMDFAAELNGSFIIIIIDDEEDAVIIANDRTASKPLFYFVDDQTLFFAPEMKSLLLIPSIEKKLNHTAISNFLAVGYFINGDTLIDGIKILDNASIIKVKDSKITNHKYWHYKFDETPVDKGFDYYQKILSKLICKAVYRRIRTDHRYGILLSGGYDSRGILGCYINEKGKKDVNTISWGLKEDIPKSDCEISRKLANKLGINHRFYKLKPEKIVNNLSNFIFLTDGQTDAFTNYPEELKIFQNIKHDRGIQIILRGDECFGWHSAAFDEHTMFKTLGIYPLDGMTKYKNILKKSYYEKLIKLNSETMKSISSRCDAKNIHNRKDIFYLTQRLQYYLNPLNYVKNIELEVRNPWSDNDILDFMCTVPVKYRLDKNLYRKTIVEIFPELFDEIAQKSNLINWEYEFKNSELLKDYIYKELIKNKNDFHEFINIDNLKSELDIFFESKNHARTYGIIEKIFTEFPIVYKYAQKWLIKSKNNIPMKTVIIRMLTIKISFDLFIK